MIEIQDYKKANRALWDAFVAEANVDSFLITRSFIEHNKTRFKEKSCLLLDDDLLQGIFPAAVQNEEHIVSHPGLTFAGLICKNEVKIEKLHELYKALFAHYKKAGFTLLRVKLAPLVYQKQASMAVDYIMNVQKANCVSVMPTLVIDFSYPFSFQTRRLRAIKKAQKKGLKVSFENKFNGFWNEILEPHLKEKFDTSPVHNLNTIRYLGNLLPDQIVQVNAYEDAKIVAGITLFVSENIIKAQYIASNQAGRNVGALDLLVQTIADKYAKSKRFFDLGTSNIPRSSALNDGLIDWKEGFGAKVYNLIQYEIAL